MTTCQVCLGGGECLLRICETVCKHITILFIGDFDIMYFSLMVAAECFNACKC